eukprot:g71.t1
MNYWLLTVCIFVPVGLLLGNAGLVQLWRDKDDESYLCGFVVTTLALTFAECSVLLIGVDVSNGGGINWLNTSTIDMNLAWTFVFWGTALLCFVIIPWTVLYYESYEDEETTTLQQITNASLCLFFFIVVLIPIFVLMYLMIGYAFIPFTDIYPKSQTAITNMWQENSAVFDSSTGNLLSNAIQDLFTYNTTTSAVPPSIRLQVSPTIYLVAFMSFLGWFLFTAFVGVGLMYLPYDFIAAFLTRKPTLEPAVFTKEKDKLKKHCKMLKDIARNIQKEQRTKGKEQRSKDAKLDTKTIRQFKQAVWELDEDWRTLKVRLA